jgi:methionine-rich copper-binding protein CopC
VKISILAAAFALTATFVLAHAKPATMTPEDGSTVTAPEVIAIHFDAPMRVTAFTLTGPDGDIAVTRTVGMEPVTQFDAAPGSPLLPADYTVEWRGMSQDGHPMQGSFAFAVAD